MKDPTGELINSIKISKANKSKSGIWGISVRATGNATNRKTGTLKTYVSKSGKAYTETSKKLLSLEYGDSRHKTPKPFMQKTTNDSENEVINKMQEVYNKEV